MVGKVKFEARIKELVENLPDLAVLVEPLLIVRRVLREQIVVLHGTIRNSVCEAIMMEGKGASYGYRERPAGPTFSWA